MSRLLCTALIACFALTASFDAEAANGSSSGLRPAAGPLGLGLNLGWPTGLAGKYYLTDNQGITFGVGVGGPAWIGGYVDYVWAPVALVNIEPGTLYPYIGGGVFLGAFPYRNPFLSYLGNIPLLLGAEMPLGLTWNFTALPLDIYLEAAPGLAVFPALDFGIRGSLGFRYYF